MSPHSRSAWSGLFGRIPTVVSELPWLSAAEQTRLSWARRVDAYAEVPVVFQGFFDALAQPPVPFPYTVLTPSYAGFLVRTNEKLLCDLASELCIIERIGDSFTVTKYPVETINYIEFGTVLLKSWLTVSGRTAQGELASNTTKFNTVTDYLFTPFVGKIRATDGEGETEDLATERAKFNHLGKTHFKFMNVAKRNILPGEHVLQSLMQPIIRSEIVRLFGHALSRTLAPAHMAILTERELIMIRDEDQDFWSGETTHGSIKTYIPLARIADEPGGIKG